MKQALCSRVIPKGARIVDRWLNRRRHRDADREHALSRNEKQFGWVADFQCDGTDDTVMKYLLAEALIRTRGYATYDDWAQVWLDQWDDIFGVKVNKFSSQCCILRLSYVATVSLEWQRWVTCPVRVRRCVSHRSGL